jgi:hypothetical protein
MPNKSGGLKRKEKQQKIFETHAQKLPKLTHFFLLPPHPASEEVPAPAPNTEETVYPHAENCDEACSRGMNECSSEIASRTVPLVSPVITEDNSLLVTPFSRPHASLRMEFMHLHPIQPLLADLFIYLPFRANKIYLRKLKAGDVCFEILQRSWISYSVERDALFCSVCLAFGAIISRALFACQYAPGAKTSFRYITLNGFTLRFLSIKLTMGVGIMRL